MARRGPSDEQLNEHRRQLEDHYARHATIPSMAGLARMWGYASKSSASRRVDDLVRQGVLTWSPDRRLAPGPAFGVDASADGEGLPQSSPGAAANRNDPLPAALEAWAIGYDSALVRAYSISTRLLRIARSLEQWMAQSAAREGLTPGDVLLLDALYRVGPPHRITPTALKEYFFISLAGVGKRVDRLEAQGFITRIPNPDDRRGLFIELTPQGRDALARLVEADQSAPPIVWPLSLSDGEYHALLHALVRAEAMIDDYSGNEK